MSTVSTQFQPSFGAGERVACFVLSSALKRHHYQMKKDVFMRIIQLKRTEAQPKFCTGAVISLISDEKWFHSVSTRYLVVVSQSQWKVCCCLLVCLLQALYSHTHTHTHTHTHWQKKREESCFPLSVCVCVRLAWNTFSLMARAERIKCVCVCVYVCVCVCLCVGLKSGFGWLVVCEISERADVAQI